MSFVVVNYRKFTCDGCGVTVDVPERDARPLDWVEDGLKQFHDVECWFATITSRRVLIQGRGYLAFSEAAEDYLK